MTSKTRVKETYLHKTADRIPAAFHATGYTVDALLEKYGFSDIEQLYGKYQIDIRYAAPVYAGPEEKTTVLENGETQKETYWGFTERYHFTGLDYDTVFENPPLADMSTLDELKRYAWPQLDWFDFDSVTEACEKHADKGIVAGQQGVFQFAAKLRGMENIFMDMAADPQMAHYIFDRMVEFELAFYERVLQAGKGMIDILRPHDDYGTQRGLLFSVDMWRKYFKENTKKLVDLAHKHGAFYQQHSCGAVRTIIPELIDCGVDALEPIQKVEGMECESLKKEFGDKIVFHGGIDTQKLLPNATVDEVKEETEYFIDTMGRGGGYVLYGSQAYEGDIPLENIEAIYAVDRVVK